MGRLAKAAEDVHDGTLEIRLVFPDVPEDDAIMLRVSPVPEPRFRNGGGQ